MSLSLQIILIFTLSFSVISEQNQLYNIFLMFFCVFFCWSNLYKKYNLAPKFNANNEQRQTFKTTSIQNCLGWTFKKTSVSDFLIMDAIRRESVYQFSQLFSVTLCTKCSSPRRSNRRWGKARASLAPGRPGGQREERRGTLSAVGLQAAIDRREGLASQGRH